MDGDVDRYVGIMDDAGIDVACINCIFYGDARYANDLVAELCSRRPDRFVPVAFVTPHYPGRGDPGAGAGVRRAWDEVPEDIPGLLPQAERRPGVLPDLRVAERARAGGDDARDVLVRPAGGDAEEPLHGVVGALPGREVGAGPRRRLGPGEGHRGGAGTCRTSTWRRAARARPTGRSRTRSRRPGRTGCCSAATWRCWTRGTRSARW